MRSAADKVVGGVVVGITIVGALPKVPAGEAQGIDVMPATAAAVEHVVDRVPIVVVVVGPDDTVVVVVGMETVEGDERWKKRAAEPITRTATMVTITPRRMFLRRLFWRASASIF
jgi:hypothetical protein